MQVKRRTAVCKEKDVNLGNRSTLFPSVSWGIYITGTREKIELKDLRAFFFIGNYTLWL